MSDIKIENLKKTGTTSEENHTAEIMGDAAPKKTVEVLYQKMGNRWFTFSMIDDELYLGSIAEDDLNKPSNC